MNIAQLKPRNKFLLMLAFLLCLSSCKDSSDHMKALGYFVSVGTELKKNKYIFEDFWIEAKEVALKLNNGNKSFLDSSILVILNEKYQSAMLNIDESIRILENVEEFDTTINLKKKCISLLLRTNVLQEEAIPVFFKSLRVGYENLSESEKVSFEKFKIEIQELKIANEESRKSAVLFVTKYGISDEELTIFGLK